MKKEAGILKALCMCMLLVLLGSVPAWGWGTDIPIWTGGYINAFDVDYDKDTGTMYVAFQVSGESSVRIYSSTDHGYTWEWVADTITHCTSGDNNRSGLKKIRMIYDDDTGKFYFFYVDNDGYLCVNYHYLTGTAYAKRVSTAPILEESFEVTRNLENGRIFVYYLEGTSTGDRTWVRYTDDGETWHTSLSGASWAEQGRWISIAYGPPNNIFRAFSYDTSSTPDFEIAFKASTDNGGSWQSMVRITDNDLFDYNPIVVAANKDNSGVWVVYGGAIPFSGGLSVFSRYSADGGQSWSGETSVVSEEAAISAVSVYLSDVKPFKIKPNGYIDLVYTVLTSNNDIRAYWAWTHTSDPDTWHAHTRFNDQKIRIGRGLTFDDNGPKIVYSPPETGGGVVFSYYNEGGLYFDAPWNNLTTPSTSTLTVTVDGSGSVVSSPSGINCSNNDPSTSRTCSYDFTVGTTVTLTATPIDGTLPDGTPYTSYFAGWAGACSGNDPTCEITIDSESPITVTAHFVYLIPPAYVVPLPSEPTVFNYPQTEVPSISPDPSECRPIGVGDVPGGTLNIQVHLPQFEGPVDVYLAVYAPHIDPDNVYIVRSDLGIQPASEGLVPWKSNVSAEVDESLFGEIPTDALPPGTYYLGVAVTPAGGDLSVYYLWITYFVII